MWRNICILMTVENMKTAAINNLVIVFIYMLCENVHHYWRNVRRLIKLPVSFFINLHAFEFPVCKKPNAKFNERGFTKIIYQHEIWPHVRSGNCPDLPNSVVQGYSCEQEFVWS